MTAPDLLNSPPSIQWEGFKWLSQMTSVHCLSSCCSWCSWLKSRSELYNMCHVFCVAVCPVFYSVMGEMCSGYWSSETRSTWRDWDSDEIRPSKHRQAPRCTWLVNGASVIEHSLHRDFTVEGVIATDDISVLCPHSLSVCWTFHHTTCDWLTDHLGCQLYSEFMWKHCIA